MCAICDVRIDFDCAHRMTLPVAVATRRAIEAGLLEARAVRGPFGGVSALKNLQHRLETSLTPPALCALPDFFALMIESRSWGFFHPTQAGFDTACKPDAPHARDAILITSEAAASALCNGTLSFERAHADGLLAIDADPARARALRAAFGTAFPVAAFSRFVCA